MPPPLSDVALGNEAFCWAMESISVFAFCHRAFGGTVIAAVRQATLS